MQKEQEVGKNQELFKYFLQSIHVPCTASPAKQEQRVFRSPLAAALLLYWLLGSFIFFLRCSYCVCKAWLVASN